MSLRITRPSRGTVIGIALLLILIVGMVAWRQCAVVVALRVETSADILPPDGQSRAEIRVVPTGRWGWAVPWADRRVRVAVDEGVALAEVRISDDSTCVLVTAGLEPGVLTLRISTPSFPLPVLVTLHLQAPLAAFPPVLYPLLGERTLSPPSG